MRRAIAVATGLVSLVWLSFNANKAVADAGQSIAAVTVSPTGIVITTGPAIPTAPG